MKSIMYCIVCPYGHFTAPCSHV